MKVILSAADSGSIKLAEFTNRTNTSDKNCDDYKVSVLVTSPVSTKKRKTAVLSLAVLTGEEYAYCRLNGEVGVNGEPIGKMDQALCVFYAPQSRNLVCFSSTNIHKLFKLNAKYELEKETEFKTDFEATCFAQNSENELQFACASIETLPKVITINEKKAKVQVDWKAPDLEDTILDLPEPNNVAAIALQGSKIAAVTTHGKVRAYTLDSEEMQETQVANPLKCVIFDSQNNLVVGDNRSTVSKFEFKSLKLLGTFKDVQGSTRTAHILNNFVVLGGVDRYVRVFDLNTRKLSGKVYIGDQIWAALLVSTDEDEDQKDINEMWTQIDAPNKRQKTNESFSGFDD